MAEERRTFFYQLHLKALQGLSQVSGRASPCHPTLVQSANVQEELPSAAEFSTRYGRHGARRLQALLYGLGNGLD